MPTLPAKAAAYTRTLVLKRFLEQLTASLPARVDNTYAESRLGLKGGDIRAFLQSARVLGLIDFHGGVTERARRMRATTQRAAALREALEEAYPELVHRWDLFGGMSREQIEDFFKVEYELSVSSAAPAAKLFADLMREYGGGEGRSYDRAVEPSRETVRQRDRGHEEEPQPRAVRSQPAPAATADPRMAALEAVRSSLHIEINSEWDERRIELVFDRMERLVDRILGE